MEILISVAAKAAEYLVTPIKRGASFIFYPQAVIQGTLIEYARLLDLHNGVDDLCKHARLDGEEIVEDVSKWLQVVQATLTEVDKWLQETKIDETNTNMSCIRLHSNKWVWAQKQRKNARRKKAKLVQMFRQGKNFTRISRLAPVRGMQLLSGDGFIVFASVKSAFDDIMRALMREEHSMIGVYGMGGIGKTSLVKRAGTAAEETQLFKRVVVAVASQAPSIHKIQAELGEQLCLRYSRETEVGRASQLMNRMKLESKILVILDDVWNEIDLAAIGIPFGDDHKGCKVLITTRLERVCTLMGCHPKIELNLLDEEDSWDLFKKHAGTVLSDDPPPGFEGVAKQVTRECNRLPLALIVVASALRDKSLEEWEFALKKLQSSRLVDIEDVDPNRNVYERIKLSFDFLRAEVTKRCFLMCSLFPEDHEINVGELTRYALGYGLFDQDSTIDSYMAAKTQVKITISHLLACSLLLKPDSMAERVKMHDVVRDAALWITSQGEDVFLVPIPSRNNWTRDSTLTNSTAISLLACPMNQHFPNPRDCSRLKMLLLAQQIPLPVRDTSFEGMVALQVLDMTSTAPHPLELVLPSSLQLLNNLRTLYLRRWILEGNISMIGRLKGLEILSFSGSVLTKLPEELRELSELKFLDLSACKARDGFDHEVLSHLVLRVEVFCPPSRQMLSLDHDDD